jgi:hypothetical protein
MQIDNLLAIIPPPPVPVEASGEAWEKVEERLGAVLPDDYKEFICHYGSGLISNFIGIYNPFSKRININLLEQSERQLWALRTLIGEGEVCPYELFPTPEGLLPFGRTENGDALHWLTCGSPGNWSIVVNDSRSPEYEQFDCSLSEFLVGILTQKKHCSIFPPDFSKGNAVFHPI